MDTRPAPGPSSPAERARGLDPEDVLLQLSVLWRIDPAHGGDARAARILDLIVDGLRRPRPEPASAE
ncbi:hypothetical protein ABZZ47_02030 [Streptomyces sp. NPDC006465]|uniref:hypothetical protein n=1 Tax=Streptomyces sp. NPDC006465 TaxID=3157174 RepID=UPI0033B662C7